MPEHGDRGTGQPPRGVSVTVAGRPLTLDPGTLDQHLLTDHGAIVRLVDAAEIRADDIVLDPGAGPGAISGLAAERAREVVAVEIDPQFRPLLDDVRAGHENVSIVIGDLLTAAVPDPDVVVGNPPFCVFEPLVVQLRRWRPRVAALVLGLRACRAMTAPLGQPELGRTGVLIRAYFDVELICVLEPASFTPAGRTQAGIVQLRRHARTDPILPVLADALAEHSGQRVRDFLWHLGSPAGPLRGRDDLIEQARALRREAQVADLRPKRLQALDRHELALLVRELERFAGNV